MLAVSVDHKDGISARIMNASCSGNFFAEIFRQIEHADCLLRGSKIVQLG